MFFVHITDFVNAIIKTAALQRQDKVQKKLFSDKGSEFPF